MGATERTSRGGNYGGSLGGGIVLGDACVRESGGLGLSRSVGGGRGGGGAKITAGANATQSRSVGSNMRES